MKTFAWFYIYNYSCSQNDVFDVLVFVYLEVGERTKSKTLKDLCFSDSPLERPPYREESVSRPPRNPPQVTCKENLQGTKYLLPF